MLVKKIKYTDFNGVEREEEFYFNLSKVEMMELEVGTKGGLAEKIKSTVDAKDNAGILKIFKDMILKSFGIKSEDGKRFVKSEQLRTEFEQSEAYSELFMELASDGDKAAAFVNGIIPQMEVKDITQK